MASINSLINYGRNARRQMVETFENYAERGLISQKTLKSIKAGKKCTEEMNLELNRAEFFKNMSPEEIKEYYTGQIAQANIKCLINEELIKKIAKDAYKPL